LAWFEGEGESVSAFVEPFVIFLILAANATVGVLQEQKAEVNLFLHPKPFITVVLIASSTQAAIEALKAYEAENAVVIRDGTIKEIPASELVCGDLVQVSEGQQVPADLRMLELVSVTFRIDQSILTGKP
jgi:P-type Ca2+ transporter type 2A